MGSAPNVCGQTVEASNLRWARRSSGHSEQYRLTASGTPILSRSVSERLLTRVVDFTHRARPTFQSVSTKLPLDLSMARW